MSKSSGKHGVCVFVLLKKKTNIRTRRICYPHIRKWGRCSGRCAMGAVGVPIPTVATRKLWLQAKTVICHNICSITIMERFSHHSLPKWIIIKSFRVSGWWGGGLAQWFSASLVVGWMAPKITHIQRVPMTMTSTADKPTEWQTEWLKWMEGIEDLELQRCRTR